LEEAKRYRWAPIITQLYYLSQLTNLLFFGFLPQYRPHLNDDLVGGKNPRSHAITTLNNSSVRVQRNHLWARLKA
jgi:hypothetical protein